MIRVSMSAKYIRRTAVPNSSLFFSITSKRSMDTSEKNK
jgi:hypothetical protein